MNYDPLVDEMPKMRPVMLVWHNNSCTMHAYGLGHDILYLSGDKPPRYPVPTLAGRVFFTRWVVCLFTTDPCARDYICEKRWDADA